VSRRTGAPARSTTVSAASSPTTTGSRGDDPPAPPVVLNPAAATAAALPRKNRRFSEHLPRQGFDPTILRPSGSPAGRPACSRGRADRAGERVTVGLADARASRSGAYHLVRLPRLLRETPRAAAFGGGQGLSWPLADRRDGGQARPLFDLIEPAHRGCCQRTGARALPRRHTLDEASARPTVRRHCEELHSDGRSGRAILPTSLYACLPIHEPTTSAST